VAGVTYHAFCDPSGGSQDAMTLALAHVERGVAVLDLVRERKPKFDPATVVHEFAETLRAYGIGQLVGDRYGGVWVEQAFRERGIEYVASADSKSELYVRLVPLVNTGKVALLDQPTIVAQACGLERRVGRGTGQEVVDHGVHAHDDVINAVAGALVLASGGSAADTWVRFAAEYYGSRGERTAPAPAATRTVLSQEPTPQRCGCGAVFNAADRVTACPSCGVPVGTAAPAAHLPDLFPEAPVAAAPARRLGSCSRCGTLVDYTPSADGSPVRCPSCGLQP